MNGSILFTEPCVLLQSKIGLHTRIRLQDNMGYIYSTGTKYNKDRCYWRCTLYRRADFRCKATAISQGNWIVQKFHHHSHPPDQNPEAMQDHWLPVN